MLDTVRLRSPHLSEALAEVATAACELRQGLCIATGEVLYSFTSGKLEGSYDHRVQLKVRREEWVCPPALPGQRRTAVLVACPPYLVVEGSVHKAMLGHNVSGGPEDPRAACRWFVAHVGRALGVQLPDGDLWTVERADWAEVFDLGGFAAVEEYVHRLKGASFPRRKAATWGCEAVQFVGASTTVKLYHKGPEFRAHDAKRLCGVLPDCRLVEVAALQAEADGLLRFEVEVHSRKLRQDGRSTVAALTREYLEAVHDTEADRVLREGQTDMEIVRRNREVAARLEQAYAPELAHRLFGTWMQFAALGEDVVRQRMSRRTFYRQRKQLADVGVCWVGADVRIVASLSLVPDGFAPIRRDPRRLQGEAGQVVTLLQPYRQAAA